MLNRRTGTGIDPTINSSISSHKLEREVKRPNASLDGKQLKVRINHIDNRVYSHALGAMDPCGCHTFHRAASKSTFCLMTRFPKRAFFLGDALVPCPLPHGRESIRCRVPAWISSHMDSSRDGRYKTNRRPFTLLYLSHAENPTSSTFPEQNLEG